MAYEFDVAGWEDWDGNRHEGKPDDADLPDVGGMFVHYSDPDTGDSGYFWTFIELPDEPNLYWNWDDWYDLIDGIMNEEYGLETA